VLVMLMLVVVEMVKIHFGVSDAYFRFRRCRYMLVFPDVSGFIDGVGIPWCWCV